MAYSFDQIFAADPSNPSNVAQNSAVTIFAVGDTTMTPLTITDPDGQPLTNPVMTNANGFGSAFAHATLDRVAWAGGSFTGFFTSYEGMKNEAVAARAAAQTAEAAASASATAATTAADDAVASVAANIDSATASAAASAQAAQDAAALVEAPADTAIATVVSAEGTETRAVLDDFYEPRNIDPDLNVSLTNLTATRDGKPTSFPGAVTLIEPATTTAGAVGLQRGTTNIVPDPTFATATVGVLGSGGVLPSGWEKRFAFAYEILSISAGVVTLKISRTGGTPSGLGAGIRLSVPGVTVPAGSTMVAARAKLAMVAATANVTRAGIPLSVYNSAGVFQKTENGQFINTPDGVDYSMETITSVTGTDKVSFNVLIELGAGNETADFSVTLRFSMPQVEQVRNLEDATTYHAGARPDSSLQLHLDAGSYKAYLHNTETPGSVIPVTSDGVTAPVAGTAITGSVNASGVTVFPSDVPALRVIDKAEEVAPPKFAAIPSLERGTRIGTHYWDVVKPNTNAYVLGRASNRHQLTRFELRPGDAQSQDAANGTQRVELAASNNLVAPFNTDVWASYWLKVESAPTAGDWRIFQQWRGSDDVGDSGRSPVWTIHMLANGTLEVVTRAYAAATFVGTGWSTPVAPVVRYSEPNYPIGEWVHWVHRIQFTPGTLGGHWQGWRNGVEVHNAAVPIGYNDALGPQFRHGIYRAASTERTATQMAHVTWGTTSLLSQVTNPPAIV